LFGIHEVAPLAFSVSRTIIKYLHGAASIGLGTTIKYLRRTSRHRPEHHDQVPAMHNEERNGQRPGRQNQVPATHNERRRGQWPEPKPGVADVPIHQKRPSFAFFLCAPPSPTSEKALHSLVRYTQHELAPPAFSVSRTIIKYLHGAASIGLGTTIKYLRRTSRHRPEHHDQVPAMHNEGRNGQRPGRQNQVPATHNERCRGQWPEPVPGVADLPIHQKRPSFAFFVRAFVAN
jgi:radical SAM superfamily enzyme with C-terminal helix-hairpin-helix motif